MDCLVCFICGKRFSDLRMLQLHVRIHTEYVNYDSPVSITCPACNSRKPFTSLKAFYAHIRWNLESCESSNVALKLPPNLQQKKRRLDPPSPTADVLMASEQSGENQLELREVNNNEAGHDQEQFCKSIQISESSVRKPIDSCLSGTLAKFVSMLRCKGSCTEGNIDAVVCGVSNVIDGTIDSCIRVIQNQLPVNDHSTAALESLRSLKHKGSYACKVGT